MQTEVFSSQTLESIPTAWVVALLTVFVVLGLWSSFGRLKAGGSLGLKAKNLFLTVKTQAGYQVHIVTWGPQNLTLVSPKYLAKGETLRLDVGSLAGYPDGAGPLALEVTHARVMRGEKDTFVITARVASASSDERTSVRRFLEQLTRPGRLSHA